MTKPLLAFLAIALPASANFVNVPLTAGASSQTHEPPWNISETLNDPFAYDPANPVAAAPEQAQRGPAAGWHVPGFHGQELVAEHFLRYSFAPVTTPAGGGTFAVDLWGRSTPSIIWGRDDNYVVVLYNGGFAPEFVVASSPLSSIAPVAPYHQRTSFALAGGIVFDRFEVYAANTLSFTIMETRAAWSADTAALTYEQFALIHGLGPADGDDDVDGAENILEFAAGSDPEDPAALPLLTATPVPAGVRIAFTRRAAVAGVGLALKKSEKFLSWDGVEQDPASIDPQGGGIDLLTYVLPVPAPSVFFRLETVTP
jgi:hypothetical protein